MIEAAEHDGRLKPGGSLIEATAGNTGLGLALVAAQKRYRLTLVVPDNMAQEKIFHLRALGAEVILTRSDVGKGPPIGRAHVCTPVHNAHLICRLMLIKKILIHTI